NHNAVEAARTEPDIISRVKGVKSAHHPYMHRPPFRALNYRFAPAGPACSRMWQFLYFLPLPHGHGSLRPTRSLVLRIGSIFFGASVEFVVMPFWPSAAAVSRGAASWIA